MLEQATATSKFSAPALRAKGLRPHQMALAGIVFGVSALGTILFFTAVQAIGFGLVATVFAYSFLQIQNEREAMKLNPGFGFANRVATANPETNPETSRDAPPSAYLRSPLETAPGQAAGPTNQFAAPKSEAPSLENTFSAHPNSGPDHLGELAVRPGEQPSSHESAYPAQLKLPVMAANSAEPQTTDEERHKKAEQEIHRVTNASEFHQEAESAYAGYPWENGG